MTDMSALGPWLRRFLLEYLVTELNLTRNTQLSYRDTLVLLLPFLSEAARKPVERLGVLDLTPEIVLRFLGHLEQQRGCTPQTRNQRLTAVRAFARFVGSRSPEHVEWCAQIRALSRKKVNPPPVCYLEKSEMDALLAAPPNNTLQGRRDRAVLLCLYNTGGRASEIAGLRIGDVQLAKNESEHSLVTLRGKRGKQRRCPLWPRTARALAELMTDRAAEEAVFLSRHGKPFTRFGLRALVQRHAAQAADQVPSLAGKCVGPHVVRHTAGTHQLRAGVDINTIRAWLGHARLDTTNIYVEIDVEAKQRALGCCSPGDEPEAKPWRKDPSVLEFLRNL
ncbi:MAG: tyrosine-type recombinase/integrase [Bryobacterales bacterium]|nr:tyrosine-type recombinase/integrase [Bryobacterales bacterium]